MGDEFRSCITECFQELMKDLTSCLSLDDEKARGICCQGALAKLKACLDGCKKDSGEVRIKVVA